MRPASRLAAIAPLALLCACGEGGGGGSVASTPAPLPSPTPTPTPTPAPVTVKSIDVVKTPLTGLAGQVAGTTPAIAFLYERGKSAKQDEVGPETGRFLDPAAVRLTAGPQSNTYTLEFAPSGYPASQTFDLGHSFASDGKISGETEFGNHIVRTTTYSDGSKDTESYDAKAGTFNTPFAETSPTTGETRYFTFDLGLRYVTYGTWNRVSWERVTTVSPACPSGQCWRNGIGLPESAVQFVAGRRTLPGELPKTGSATFDAAVVGSRNFMSFDSSKWASQLYFDKVRLTADFAKPLMSAAISADPYNDGEYFSSGIKANGSGLITSNGSYAFPLTGTVTAPSGSPAATETIAGNLQGALFGPGAEETGGILLITEGGAPVMSATFAGGRAAP